MTFSLAARCPQTGMFGVAVTTSGIAVGSRCSFARPGVGAVLTQHRTDPRLGPQGLDYLAAGHTAAQTIAHLAATAPHAEWRQLAVIDAHGHTAFFHGEAIKSIHGASEAADCVAIGNILANTRVPAAMTAAFTASSGQPLPARLVHALQAGLDAGGERSPLRSAHLLVAHEHEFPWVDLRVDDADAPITELARLWTAYAPEAEDYVRRVLDPGSFGPSKG